MTQKATRVLEILQEQFGGVFTAEPSATSLTWRGRNALPVLETMLPYLIVKKEQARLAIEWISLVGGPGVRVPTAARQRRLAIVDELRMAKKVS